MGTNGHTIHGDLTKLRASTYGYDPKEATYCQACGLDWSEGIPNLSDLETNYCPICGNHLTPQE